MKAINETRRLAIEKLTEARVAPRRMPKIVATEDVPAGTCAGTVCDRRGGPHRGAIADRLGGGRQDDRL
ncbi:MAG: hypothetical protein MZU95_08235 [Desulfomicrobium escambiense]|nr:hypothetical protein [Desulfomicrobium escambiense]